MQLKEGVYESLINKETDTLINKVSEEGGLCKKSAIDKAESSYMLSQYFSSKLQGLLNNDDLTIEERISIVNKGLKEMGMPEETLIVDESELLTEVLSKTSKAKQEISKKETLRPETGFRTSFLFTGGQSALSMDSEIQKDINTADEICLIVSFLKLSGINIFLKELRDFCNAPGHKLRIITTTYCGITEEKALLQISRLPNTEIRISYDTKNERLHAKSYIFLRNSGMHTAYIGSSNLSKSALTDGLEWNIRVTSVENLHIINTARATFERYWNSPNFEDFSIGGIDKFREEKRKEKEDFSTTSSSSFTFTRYSILPHQNKILSKLRVEREEKGNYRNLVVAATGTGKTVISAFDYQIFCQNNDRHRLLFVAHREEILRQAMLTYRSVLQDANFGSMLTGNIDPKGKLDYLFVSVATLKSRIEKFKTLGEDYYDYIVVDEAHHGAANSYTELFEYFKPKILLGLTATPERMDGKSLLPYFNGHISAEIRLPEALLAGLLSPFKYYCISDNVDLSDESLWINGHYDKDKLSLLLSDDERAGLVVEKLREYIADENKVRALCFCTDKSHAAYMADYLCKAGLKAQLLTSDTNETNRKLYAKQLQRGDINYLCVVDVFNEGVDLPAVDTVLFLRPTESLTIFLQQLGRGLRLSPGKEHLTVLDFVGQANNKYNFTERFRSLSVNPRQNIKKEVENGFSTLPAGCTITMEEKAQQYILENIKNAIYSFDKLVKELRKYTVNVSLSEFLNSNGQDVRLIYNNNHCWTELKMKAGKCGIISGQEFENIKKGMHNFVHVNSLRYLHFLREFCNGSERYKATTGVDHKYSLMLYYSIFQKKITDTGYTDTIAALDAFKRYNLLVLELLELVDYLIDTVTIKTVDYSHVCSGLDLYGCYTREEVFMLFGKQTPTKKMQGSAAGVIKVADDTEVFFVTLNKSDKDFSPSTQYKDYLINKYQFHWQSQNDDSHSGKGYRFVDQEENGKKFILFVRENKKDGYKNTCPFHCFGLVDYVSSEGDYPMNIVWQLRDEAMPQYVKAI